VVQTLPPDPCAGYLRHPDRILPSRNPLVVVMQAAQNRDASELR
jgi:hypothetical protein